jgi:hypothetical protein
MSAEHFAPTGTKLYAKLPFLSSERIFSSSPSNEAPAAFRLFAFVKAVPTTIC